MVCGNDHRFCIICVQNRSLNEAYHSILFYDTYPTSYIHLLISQPLVYTIGKPTTDVKCLTVVTHVFIIDTDGRCIDRAPHIRNGLVGPCVSKRNTFDYFLYNTLFSREENFAKSEFEIFSREDIFANILFPRKYLPAKISSRENIFPRKYPPAKIVCLFRQRSFLFAVFSPVIGDTGSRPNVRY